MHKVERSPNNCEITGNAALTPIDQASGSTTDDTASGKVRASAPMRGGGHGLSLTEGPVRAHLWRLTVPMLLGMASMMIASMIDTIYVGKLGTAPLAAVSFSFPVVMVMVSLSMGVGMGATSIIARSMGGGNRARVRRLATDALLLVMLISTVCGVAGIVYAEPMFRALGAHGEMLALVVRYMHIWFLGLPLFALPMVATSIMRAVGSARAPGIIMTSSSVIQVVTAPILMFGIPGLFDGIGFEGSPWAFVISRAATFVLCIYMIGPRMKLLVLSGGTLNTLRESWREVLRIGVPSSLSQLIAPVSMAIVIRMLSEHGPAVVAALGVASRIESLATMVLMSLSGSLAPFIGQNFGGRMDGRIHEALRECYRFSLLYALIAAVVLGFTGSMLVGMINNDPAVIEATHMYLLLVPISYGMLGVAMCASTSFMALGKPMPTLIMSVARMFVLYVPVAWVGNQLFGYAGVFAATAFANIAMGGIAYVWAKSALANEIRVRDQQLDSAR